MDNTYVRPIIKLEELPKRLAKNHILVRMDIVNKNRRTKNGIWMASGADDKDLDSVDIYHQIDRCGTVKMVSDLFFDVLDIDGIDYDTEMEVQIGDQVWMRQIEANTSMRILCKGDYYKIVRYDSLTVAKRGKKVIPLNGHVLMEEVFAPPSKWIKIREIPLAGKGKIKYLGTKNKDYKFNYALKMSGVIKMQDVNDGYDVKVGDIVDYELIAGMKLDLYLESEMFATFGEKLKICHRKDIIPVTITT